MRVAAIHPFRQVIACVVAAALLVAFGTQIVAQDRGVTHLDDDLEGRISALQTPLRQAALSTDPSWLDAAPRTPPMS
jgi:hypothetical protein